MDTETDHTQDGGATNSKYDRPPLDHPIIKAIWDLDERASATNDIRETLAQLDIGLTASELTYFAEQRALRSMIAFLFGPNLSKIMPEEVMAASITGSETWARLRIVFCCLHMEGVAIGWHARGIAEGHSTTLAEDSVVDELLKAAEELGINLRQPEEEDASVEAEESLLAKVNSLFDGLSVSASPYVVRQRVASAISEWFEENTTR